MFRFLSVVPAMMCTAAIVAAQAPATPATPAAPAAPTAQQPPADVRPTTAAKVTYTGCVKPGTAPDTWILDNADVTPSVKADAGPGQSTVGTSGTMKATLNLSAKAGTDLKPHANHKVEVIGTIAPAKLSMPSADAPASAAVRQELSVESLKMVSTTCP